jgi:hypothetical protein
MSHHRFPICPTSGKVRYGERKDIKLEMRQVNCDRARARLNDVACSRNEIRSYSCSDCRGWHLTSTPARPVRLLPVMDLTAETPEAATRQASTPTTATHRQATDVTAVHESAAQAMRRMVSATGPLVRAAA